MNRQVVKTEENSTTLFVPELNQHYHSMRGAIQESQHVFIEAGLEPLLGSKKIISILEMGFGTGLNALMTLHVAEKAQQEILYTSIEKFPITMAESESLNFDEWLDAKNSKEILRNIHACEWNKPQKISPFFDLNKCETDLRKFETQQKFDIVYYDAFAPSAQPELWTEEIFSKLHSMMNDGGVLVTYCVKGDVRRAMKAAGFAVEKIPGPAGKREMARAFKKF